MSTRGVSATLVRPGFYPAGGGRLEVEISPIPKLQPMELRERGSDQGRRVVAHLAALGTHVAERAFTQLEKRMGWPRSACEIIEHPAMSGPGFVVMGEAAFEHMAETFTGFGERAVRAELVADTVVEQARRYLTASAPVGEYLADQLLIPLALADGGVFRCIGLSRHAQTNIQVIEQFLPVRFSIGAVEAGGVEVRLLPSGG